jgi:hypothetical protein
MPDLCGSDLPWTNLWGGDILAVSPFDSAQSLHVSGHTLPRIALFQAYLRFHSSTVFSALMLAGSGYLVDVFLYRIDESTPTDSLPTSDNIFLHHFDAMESPSKHHASLYRRAVRRILNYFKLCIGYDKDLIPQTVIQLTDNIIRQQRYNALIGIDKGGLLWAGAIARSAHTPLIYSSLELYTSDHRACKDPWIRRFKTIEKEYHKRCCATIVQDPIRGTVLLNDNEIRCDMRMLYVPVCRMGGPIQTQSDWLRRALNLNKEQIIILSYGLIAEHRSSLELAKVAQSFPDDWLLVFHGFATHRQLNNLPRSTNVVKCASR